MAIHEWWDSEPNQRFWMEVVTTGEMGTLLIAPKEAEAFWGYDLVSRVRAGDRVLHWKSEGKIRAFVGWSMATSDPEVTPAYTWQAGGTSGRLAGLRTTEDWVVSLRFQPV